MFVVLAHELEHVQHVVKGQWATHVINLGPKASFYPHLEELETIEQSDTGENAIRAEHMIEVRFGHAIEMRDDDDEAPSSALLELIS